ncbi:hypothetical protein ARMGADRAFT_1093133 [Armillaria gallica]|uniref:Uncharacterized protein n=1 Tax=Armillaria gallica TaxID=47427 RepID=A0A2H3CRR1_ARMGA|nr:hypothetical protein ARMGADRAFT_1093133 [Armillaria gallica]
MLKEKEQDATDTSLLLEAWLSSRLHNLLRGFILSPFSRTCQASQSATSGIRMHLNIQAESYVGAIPFCVGSASTSYACQKRCHCHHWPEARWRVSMSRTSIIQDDSTGTIVSRPKRTPPLGSSSSHQLILSRAAIEAYQLLGHAVKGGQSVYAPQVTRCTAPPRLARWISTMQGPLGYPHPFAIVYNSSPPR